MLVLPNDVEACVIIYMINNRDQVYSSGPPSPLGGCVCLCSFKSPLNPFGRG